MSRLQILWLPIGIVMLSPEHLYWCLKVFTKLRNVPLLLDSAQRTTFIHRVLFLNL